MKEGIFKVEGLVERELCVVTKRKDLEDLFSFGEFPVFMGCTNQPFESDVMSRMDWVISRGSGVIQLKKVLPLEILYGEHHGSGEIGRLWRQHHEDFAVFISEALPSAVLEIGGAHGILEAIHSRKREIPWTIIEPNPHPVPESQATFVKGFFDRSFRSKAPFDTVIHSHVMEHIFDPNEFLESLSKLMSDGQNMIFSVPNMGVMLDRGYTNCLNFEHTVLLAEAHVEFLLARHGFDLKRKKYFRSDHSIFYHATKSVQPPPLPPARNLYHQHKESFLAYVDGLQSSVLRLNRTIAELKSPVYIFGAHIFAQSLVSLGMDTSKVVGILDNDPNKQDRRLYGTRLSVRSPLEIFGLEEVNVVLRAGAYEAEIQSQLLAINEGCRFLS